MSIVLVGGSILWVQFEQAGNKTTVDDANTRDVGIIFGAGLDNNNTTPSAYLKNRLDVGKELLNNGKVEKLLLTGDNGEVSYNEPEVMQDYLEEQGVSPDKIELDYAGFDTLNSCIRANKVFSVQSAIVVTQDYHLPRAMFLCSHAGISLQGVGADIIGGKDDPIFWYTVREVLASAKAALDTIIGTQPKFTE